MYSCQINNKSNICCKYMILYLQVAYRLKQDLFLLILKIEKYLNHWAFKNMHFLLL